MKFLYSLVLVSLFLSPVSANAECLDISGDYSTGIYKPGEGELIWSHKQEGCDSIATGYFYYLPGENKTVVENDVTLVAQGKQDLCEIGKCIEFEAGSDEILVFNEGHKKINGTTSCHYKNFTMELDHDGNLVRNFFIDDSSRPCRQMKVFSKTWLRMLPTPY